MFISLIAALTPDYVIGKNHQLPWHMPADLAHFKKLTRDKPVIMGRKTYDSIGRPLPERRNIILTRDKNFTVPGCEVMHSLEEALTTLAHTHCPEVFIIGGSEIYAKALPQAHRLYLTFIEADIKDGDTYFPQWNPQEWKMISEEFHARDPKNPYNYCFKIFEKIKT